MARNQEKAQSMLYRFREQQAIEMGMGNRIKGDRRPRMASSVSSLRECERWRGDIMRDINRKVGKIQDVSLSNFEIRDLNDEINALFREKRHWETQIVNLGGANYKRGNVAMTDDQGREVPGTRGYKYFGRAKELPGVKELFERGATQATEESARNASFQMFRHQGPSYYGDEDEMDATLAEEEDELAKQEWEAAALASAKLLDVASSSDIPSYPIASTSSSSSTAAAVPQASSSSSSSKRKAPVNDKDAEAAEADEEEEDSTKKAKTSTEANGSDSNGNTVPVLPPKSIDEAMKSVQSTLSSFLNVLDPQSLQFPTMPNTSEMEGVLLEVRKKALRDEYGV
ncbi:uncharacterized protein I303_105287 [Kwoniella dejecticola CBS 10117]|uniref:Pre-mRNA-splicing factor ISY1 n=1 Tax=Kwoniella dejecticola CBS 10117 TaxID=1296121 RepID=A0A1A6A2W6_9TREE|nr:uncharacterized protein I303_05265 [Kwoniella dejecticola CBS 10117]OBR84407.1 hypothetical protein I303_05265 [Kwoniella dejecticola CBS 10117]